MPDELFIILYIKPYFSEKNIANSIIDKIVLSLTMLNEVSKSDFLPCFFRTPFRPPFQFHDNSAIVIYLLPYSRVVDSPQEPS